MPKTQMICRASLLPWSPALAPTKSMVMITRCASPLAYWPVYTAPTPKGKNPARIPATVGFGPLPLMCGGGGGSGGIGPNAVGAPIVAGAPIVEEEPPETDPEGTPSIFAPRHSSQ